MEETETIPVYVVATPEGFNASASLSPPSNVVAIAETRLGSEKPAVRVTAAAEALTSSSLSVTSPVRVGEVFPSIEALVDACTLRLAVLCAAVQSIGPVGEATARAIRLHSQLADLHRRELAVVHAESEQRKDMLRLTPLVDAMKRVVDASTAKAGAEPFELDADPVANVARLAHYLIGYVGGSLKNTEAQPAHAESALRKAPAPKPVLADMHEVIRLIELHVDGEPNHKGEPLQHRIEDAANSVVTYVNELIRAAAGAPSPWLPVTPEPQPAHAWKARWERAITALQTVTTILVGEDVGYGLGKQTQRTLEEAVTKGGVDFRRAVSAYASRPYRSSETREQLLRRCTVEATEHADQLPASASVAPPTERVEPLVESTPAKPAEAPPAYAPLAIDVLKDAVVLELVQSGPYRAEGKLTKAYHARLKSIGLDIDKVREAYELKYDERTWAGMTGEDRALEAAREAVNEVIGESTPEATSTSVPVGLREYELVGSDAADGVQTREPLRVSCEYLLSANTSPRQYASLVGLLKHVQPLEVGDTCEVTMTHPSGQNTGVYDVTRVK